MKTENPIRRFMMHKHNVHSNTLIHRMKVLECLKYIFDFVSFSASPFQSAWFIHFMVMLLRFFCCCFYYNCNSNLWRKKLFHYIVLVGIYRIIGEKKNYTISIENSVHSMIYLVNKLFIFFFSIIAFRLNDQMVWAAIYLKSLAFFLYRKKKK